ncbi:MAG TPA: hypothetical protein VMV41_09710 [Cellulomonadaceae bacterium]|nr:hypothetical protein [Cellulomonadaceae bacterium]
MKVRVRRQGAAQRLTDAERELLASIRDVGGQKVPLFDQLACRYCGGLHREKCPRVKRVEFQAGSDRPAAVEFYPWGEWPEHRVIWPSEVFATVNEPEEGSQ